MTTILPCPTPPDRARGPSGPRAMSSMKLLSLLTVAIVLIGITTQAFACYYERMSRSPNYAKITTPKKILNIPQAHGICVAPNGNFAVVSWNNAGKIYMYYSCGKLMKVVTLRGFGNLSIAHLQIATSM